jgi:hypothetical protein
MDIQLQERKNNKEKFLEKFFFDYLEKNIHKIAVFEIYDNFELWQIDNYYDGFYQDFQDYNLIQELWIYFLEGRIEKGQRLELMFVRYNEINNKIEIEIKIG